MKAIELVVEGEMPQELRDACTKVQDVMFKLHGSQASANDLALWANAMAICAGSLFGQIHEQAGVPESMDETVVNALANNIGMGMEVGRNGWRNESKH